MTTKRSVLFGLNYIKKEVFMTTANGGRILGGVAGIQLLLGGLLMLLMGFCLFLELCGVQPRLIIIATTEEFYAYSFGALLLVGLGIKVIALSFRVFAGRPVG